MTAGASGRRAIAWGLAAAAAWVALAAVSGGWSPLARRPLLDGLIPGAAYRWVAPPPDLEASNRPPEGGTFRLPIEDGATAADVVFTPDDQATVVASAGAVRDATARAVALTITPEDPAAFAPLPGDLEPFGNVYRLEAELAPSGRPVERFDGTVTAILVYPATANLHATEHELLWSADGAAWAALDATDSAAQQQVEADVEAPGLLVVGGVPAQVVASPDGGGGTPRTLSTVLLVVGGVALLLGIGFLLRARRP